jgi:class 3 adenylate cyclase/tetratricopeptide (TPR) repeat protein
MVCPSCGTENHVGLKFCIECGTPLALTCPSCGSALQGNEKFCGECGAPVQATGRGAGLAAGTPATAQPSAPPTAAERRLVSVLFADLVGFTSLSETRDSEEVRELLTRYFDASRQIISRYGGTVEKFIGDAVMAVWGTPIAQEDDAERAVRAALDLVQSVAVLGQEVGAPDLRARGGVLTGEVAVTIGAEGQGMVAGDPVNTASRIQSVAEPGTVLVGEVTKRSTEAAIVYQEAGKHELKGKAEPVPLWKALRVVAARGGARRSTALEPPFVGRDRELRLIKELFHDSADERKAHLVSVVGIAGIGKSRLAWEFDKYTDGLVETIWWHRGRCLAYGEGVAYWALAEMIRMRAGIAEGEEQESALAKLRKAIEVHVPEPGERRWIEPRLAHLVGLEERTAPDQQDLFSAWRLFFERMAQKKPLALLFEDTQWADAALLDFVEYLLEWSKDHPIFILTLARPELMDRRPTWGAGRRNFTSLFLEALSPQAMGDLLDGLVPGLPEELRDSILDRSEGVPLFAVETVRMLLDRGLLVHDGATYRPTGPIEALDVPETIQALIAARLDGLDPPERKLLQDASVVGKVFTKAGLSALTGVPEQDLDPLLTSLIRKEFIYLQADPRSPQRGQYGFLQDLVRRVAYETLSKRDRKARHLSVARYLEETWGLELDEVVELLASHYFDAFQVSPDAPDAQEIGRKARDMLTRAGERAASLAAGEEAQRYFERAIELAEDPLDRAGLLERTGEVASARGQLSAAREFLEQAIAIFESEGESHRSARVSARMGEITWFEGHIDQAIEQIERSLEVLSGDEPDQDIAWAAAQLGRFLHFAGEPERARESIEHALDMAESFALPEVLSQAMNTKSLILLARGRPEEAMVLLKHALQVALDHDLPIAAQRAFYNLGNTLYYQDQLEESVRYAREGLALAERLGNRQYEWSLLAELSGALFLMGEWDEALQLAARIPPLEESTAIRFASVELLYMKPQLFIARGLMEDAERALAPFTGFGESPDLQERCAYLSVRAALLRAQGKHAEAVSSGREAVEARRGLGAYTPGVKIGLVEAAEAAFALGDLGIVRELMEVVERLRAGDLTPFLQAQAARLGARLAAASGDSGGIEPRFKDAAGLLREIGVPFWLAVTLLEHAEWLTAQGRTDEADPLLGEARALFERLKARPWLERLTKAEAAMAAPATVA